MTKPIDLEPAGLPPAAPQAVAPSEEIAGRLYDDKALMADGEVRMTAAEDVLAWLIIEKIGVPDDVSYSPHQAQKIIENALNQATASEAEASGLRRKLEGVERQHAAARANFHTMQNAADAIRRKLEEHRKALEAARESLVTGHYAVTAINVINTALSAEPREVQGVEQIAENIWQTTIAAICDAPTAITISADAFEHCAKEAEAQAYLIEQMRGVYPGDPTGALGRDANKMRRLAKSIRQLRPAAPTSEGSHHG